MKPLSREESRIVDRLAQEKFEIPGEVLMENAGAFVARSALSLAQELGAKRVLVLAGPGNNGGDGFVAARHMLDLIEVSLLLVGDPARLKGDALANYRRYERLGEQTIRCDQIEILEQALATPPPPLILDGLFGTGLSRDVAGFPRQVIESVARSGHPVLAIDLPSGLDCDTGAILGAVIPARRTVTFVARKLGFEIGEGPALCGEIQVAPIGFPPARGGSDC